MRPLLLDLGNHPFPAVVSDADADLVADKTFYLGSNGYVYYSTWASGRSTPRTLHSLLIGPTPGAHIDHHDRHKLNNQRDNLRVVSYQRNQINRAANPMRGVRRTKASETNPWRAQITVNRKNIHLGLFPTPAAAVAARKAAELRYFGEECPR